MYVTGQPTDKYYRGRPRSPDCVNVQVVVLLLSKLLDEDGDGGRVCSHFLDEGVIELPLWLQTHLNTRRDRISVAATEVTFCSDTDVFDYLTLVSQEVLSPCKHHVVGLLHLCQTHTK